MNEEELFKSNCERWSLFDRDKAKELLRLKCKNVVRHANPDGSANLQVTKGEQVHLYHASDPVEEAKRWFEALNLRGIKLLFVYGIGLGYAYDAAKEWLRADIGRALVFLEDDLEVLYHLLHTERGLEILHDRQVWLSFLDSQGSVLNALGSSFVLMPFKVAPLDLYSKTKPENAEQLKARLAFFMDLKSGTAIEYSDRGRNFFTNFYHNLFVLPRAALGNSLFGQFAGIPAIICGAGPSLEKHLPLLATLRDRAVIFAGGTAMNALNTGGILPHFGVGIDPNTAQFSRLIMNQGFETPYFYRNRMRYTALQLIHGKHLFLTGAAGYEISSWFEERLGIKKPSDIQEGCNVINFSLAIAHELGCNPIIFVGVDLAYTHEKSYTPGILNHPIHNRKEYFGTKSAEEDVISKLDIHGKPVFTLWKWVAESLWFSQFARNHPKKTLVNSTEGGIGFSAIPNFPLAEVAENLLTKQYDIEGMIHDHIVKSPLPPQATRENVEEALRTFLESMKKCSELCNVIRKDCEETERKLNYDLDVPPLSEEGIQALEELDVEPAYQQLLKIFSDNYLEIHRRERDRLKYDAVHLGSKEIEIKKANFNGARYKFLQETAKVNKNILEAVLNEESEKQMQLLVRSSAFQAEAPNEAAAGETYAFENGKLTLIDPELNLHIEEMFTPDPEQGIRRDYYPNGGLKSEQYYLEGKLHGPSTFLSEEGKVLARSWFIRGKRQGKALGYTFNGTLTSIQRFKDGLWESKQERFYGDGKLKSLLSYANGKLHGDVLLYYPSGQLKRELHFVEGKRHGVERIWNEVGMMTIEAEFDHDKPVGTARQWYPNGNMALEIQYEKDSRNFTLREWNESGFPSLTEQRVRGDYFDQVAKQTSRLTESLNQMFGEISGLIPLIDLVASKDKAQAPDATQEQLKKIKEEINNLKRISENLQEQSGIGQEEERFWKGPTSRREVEKQVEILTQDMSKDMTHIQNSLVTALTRLAQKMKEMEEKQQQNAPDEKDEKNKKNE